MMCLRSAKALLLLCPLLISCFAGSALAQLVSSSALRTHPPGKAILRLDIEIKTRDEKNAKIGSHHLLPGSDHVWLDLGFKAWDLSELKTASGTKPFRTNGATDRWEDLPLPQGEAMTVDDLFELRLEKKGLGGLTHAADGVDGGWNPETVTLLVNGERFGGTLSVLPPGEQLDRNRPAWRHLFRDIGDEERFLYGLRVEPQEVEKGNWFSGLIAIITTPFKRLRISGWQNGPLEQYSPGDQYTSDSMVKADRAINRVSVEGTLYNPPHPGTDGYVTLDLRLQTVTLFAENGAATVYSVNSPDGIPHSRFVRVEYVRRKWGHPHDSRYRTENWRVGDRFYAEGRVLWDTDEMGFYEIHPELGEAFLHRLSN